MRDVGAPASGRLEQILERVDFFKPVATRRGFMQKLLLAGGAAAAGVAGLSKVMPALADATTDFAAAAVGSGSPWSAPGDAATSSLLNSSHRGYFQAAFNQETSHLATLRSLGVDFPAHTFKFPDNTFGSKGSMLAMGAALESIFIGAYLGAVKEAASSGNAFVAEAAAQICGIECEHRVLINDIMGIDPPNDRFYEGDLVAASDAVGDTGNRSV